MEFNMKTKAILLAGAAVLLSSAAQAMEINPYVGVDYTYSCCAVLDMVIKKMDKKDNIYSYFVGACIFHIWNF